MDPKIPSSELLKKYLSNQCSSHERDLVEAWYQSLTIESGETFSACDEEVLYERIQLQISETEHETNTPILPLRKLWYYAAAAVLFAGLFFAYSTSPKTEKAVTENVLTDSLQITFSNKEKKIIRYTLPDKSVIWLKPGAFISHPVSFSTSKNREIDFHGEAFFDVRRDIEHPFIIHCGKLKTQVLGTTFNVKANENEPSYKVSVVTGSVAVSKENSANKFETIVLKPKQEAVFEKTSDRMTFNVTPDNETINENWQSVSLVFNETPMSEVAIRLQQTFRIKIEFANPEIKKCRLKVDFNNQKLPEILGMIETLLGTTYEIEADKVILKGEGCAR
ncbi:FecR family protein [Dyadobacter koreensis]|uniref:FecR family protein n=1 Tax=Dyadobacter koreensis TaxID=408657 RepID=A0A1H6SRE7_9BACT|nr:FecR domain-containing protein [Dyadobacter koreensis]SEI70538.1 FecR family protein [Dyadobacter koreensis]